jgi:RNA polymerase sigma factor (sigma-70 family)
MDALSILSDADLWDRAVGPDDRAGDRESFGIVYDRHADRVYRHVRRLLDSHEDAEDVAATVFLEAWRRRDRVHMVDGSVLPWLLATANYVVSNRRRTLRRYRRLLVALPPAGETADHGAALLDDLASTTRVDELLRQVGPLDRDILTLCVLEGLPLAAAADVLEVPLGTVKSRLARARQRLASTLTQGEPS